MISPDVKVNLPSTKDLPCSDDTPVDNEDQNLLPNLLLFILTSIWAERMDWYFGVDMAVYHTTGISHLVPVVPDAFLSLGVERRKDGKSRSSYAVWEEDETVPILVLEMVSHTPGGEYDKKITTYANLGVLYYVIYNPEFWQRDRHQPFEVYKLIDGQYQLQIGEPYWMPEVGLGLGRRQHVLGGIAQEILCWYNREGHFYPTPDDLQAQLAQETQRAEAEYQRAEAERAKVQQMADYLRSLGVDPDHLPPSP